MDAHSSSVVLFTLLTLVAGGQPASAATDPAKDLDCSVPAPPAASETGRRQSPVADAWKVPKRPTNESTQVETLETMNRCSMALYDNAHLAARREADLVVLVRLSGATLFIDGKPVETSRVLPATYHNLRYASHVALALYVTLAPEDGVVDDALANSLEAYRHAMALAIDTVDMLPLTADQKARQHRLLDTSLKLLGRTLRDRRLPAEDLATYSRAVSRDLEENVRDAGRAQVDGLHQQMLMWRTKLTDAQWCRLRFVVRGSQQARSGHAATQYFAALSQDPGDGRGYLGESEWVVYREDAANAAQPWDPEFDLMATVELDAGVSRAIFADGDRLTMDVAAHGARARIRELDLAPFSRAPCYESPLDSETVAPPSDPGGATEAANEG